MKKAILSLLFSAAIAAASPVSVTFVSGGTMIHNDPATTLAGPYTLDIGGQEVAAMSLDDFFTAGGTWQANLTALNTTDFTNSYLFGGEGEFEHHDLTVSQIYDVEAYLFSKIVKPNADRVTLQAAAWTFMDDMFFDADIHATKAVQADIEDAVKNYKSINPAGFEIVSQVDPDSNYCTKQEFIIATPEPASIGLLGGALLAMGLFGMRSRRFRLATSSSK